jgi:Flp pilus assembly protein TadG
MGDLHSADRRHERGQALLLFVFLFTAMLFMAALLFDGANALVNRRLVQNAADAGALAGANQIQVGSPRGCGGASPRASVATAALGATTTNLGNDYTPSGPTLFGNPVTISVSCPAGYDDWAVEVTIAGTSQVFFSSILTVIGATPTGIDLAGSGTAINGNVPGSNLSVALLNPYKSTWANNYDGCPSFLLNGGPVVHFEGGMHVNSACPGPPTKVGGIRANGGSSIVTFAGSSRARVVGGYSGTIDWSPAPLTGQATVKDPLGGLPALNIASMPLRSDSRAGSTTKCTPLAQGTRGCTLNGITAVLQPGRYIGGIQLQSSAIAYLQPGIFVLQGGGLNIGAGAAIYSIPVGILATTAVTWNTDCPTATCGNLIYNTAGPAPSGTPSMAGIQVGGTSTMKLRSYNGTYEDDPYDKLLFWQDVNPVPGGTSGTAQPVLQLSGGGLVDISGTVYAPSAKVLMGGTGGGSGGAATNLTLQFISWDLEISGNTTFTFYYQEAEFTKPTKYGLVE